VKYLALAWALAALLLFHDARNVRDYLALSSAMGLRGRTDIATPLKQAYPAVAADAQRGCGTRSSLAEGNGPRLRHTDIDNAPVRARGALEFRVGVDHRGIGLRVSRGRGSSLRQRRRSARRSGSIPQRSSR
jgi:hypothetical protein